ncbi:YIF1-domain-containing protein [Violaceomyces palustris]|uniref:YIF1-domain-containing protein n=1 Tax=Violaceomyces palustris TaxID=1673888 RepID=A0ACD0NMU7_9BASI|nr:YIF1-domain-containing protein [Violaceomyces palustris]
MAPQPSSVDTSTSEPHLSTARPRAGAGAPSVIQGYQQGGYQRFSSPPIQENVVPSIHQYAPSTSPTASYAVPPPTTAGQSFYGAHPSHLSGSLAGAPSQPSSQAGGWSGGFGGGFGLGSQGMINDATAQMGVQFGRHVAQVGGEYVERNFNAILPLPVVKHYFNVSNSYVLHKLRLVLFPWRHKPWSRAHRHSSNGGSYSGSGRETPSGKSAGAEGYLPPRDDVNSPDLYIPVMSFVTYILLTSMIYGLESRFHPEILGLTASRALAIILVELSAVKLGTYLLNIQGDHTMIDLLAYSGYKFVGTLITLSVGLLNFGGLVYWSVFLYCFAANAFFLLRSLRYVILPDPSSPSSVTITHAQRSRRIQFLFSIAVAQIILGWALIVGIFHPPSPSLKST